MTEKIEICSSSQISHAKDYAEQIQADIKAAYDEGLRLRNFLLDAKWDGESKAAFQTYLDIVLNYNDDMAAAFKLQTEAIGKLQDNYDDYYLDKKVKEVRNL